MSKIKIIIIFSILILLILTITLSIFKLNQQNRSLKIESTPTPTDTKIINWNETIDLVKNCQIKVIFQARNLQVNLRDKNNQTYQTKEAKFNDIIKLAEEWQGPCDLVQTITE